jgi:hypothetical protein
MPKTFKELAQVDEACWIGYRQVPIFCDIISSVRNFRRERWRTRATKSTSSPGYAPTPTL